MLKTAKGLILNPKTFATVAVLIGAFVVAAMFMPKLWLAEVVNGVLVATQVAILWAYGPIALEGIRNPAKSTRQQYLALGLCMIAACVIVFRMWSTVYLNVGRPSWMEQHWLPLATLYALALASVFILRAPATLPGTRTRRSWRFIVMALLGGVIGGCLLLTFGNYR